MSYGKFSNGWVGSREVYSLVYTETETSAGTSLVEVGCTGTKTCTQKYTLAEKPP